MASLKGLDIIVVPVGTVLEDKSGTKMAVTDEKAVRSGGKLYVTAKQNAGIIKRAFEAPME